MERVLPLAKFITMRFEKPVPVTTIAQLIGAEITGNSNGMATGINEIHRVEKGDLVFVDHPKYYDKCLQSAASFIIINNRAVNIPEGKALLLVDHPFDAYTTIVNHFRPFIPATKAISDSAVIGEGTYIAPNAYIGEYVQI